MRCGNSAPAPARWRCNCWMRLGEGVRRYTIVDVSGACARASSRRCRSSATRVQWVSELPAAMQGVVVGNEVLDAMPVQLLVRTGGVWHERGVAFERRQAQRFVWQDRATEPAPAGARSTARTTT